MARPDPDVLRQPNMAMFDSIQVRHDWEDEVTSKLQEVLNGIGAREREPIGSVEMTLRPSAGLLGGDV